MGSKRFEILNFIRRLNRCDSTRVSYEYLHQNYDELTDGLHIVVGMTAGSELFFRVRKNTSIKPNSVADLAAPPASLVVGFQRCNPPDVPMFYAASTRLGALIESRIVAGDTVYLSQWMGKKKIPVNRIFDGIIDGSQHPAYGELDSIIVTYFDSLFTRRIHAVFSDDYKKTSAIAQLLTTRFTANEEHDVRLDGCIALRYPSVYNFESSYNTAMHAKFAHERLSLLHVAELKVKSDGDGQMNFLVTDTAWDFDDGKILWSGRPECMPIFKRFKNSVPFIFDGKRWNLVLRDESASSDELRRLLEE